MIRMTEMYRSKLNIDVSQARELAKITKGYAYAFQELGVLCFKKKENETLEDILSITDRDMSHLRCRILQIISRNTADKTRNK